MEIPKTYEIRIKNDPICKIGVFFLLKRQKAMLQARQNWKPLPVIAKRFGP